LPQRVGQGPVTFHLAVQLANPSDPTKDPTQPWPDDRRVVDLGTLTIEKSVVEEKSLLFLPGQLTDGIELSDDPLIDVRDRTYPVSFSERNG
jgi:catalase